MTVVPVVSVVSLFLDEDREVQVSLRVYHQTPDVLTEHVIPQREKHRRQRLGQILKHLLSLIFQLGVSSSSTNQNLRHTGSAVEVSGRLRRRKIFSQFLGLNGVMM